MNPSGNSPNESLNDSTHDAQHDRTTITTITSTSTLLNDDMPTEHDLSLLPMDTICLSSGGDDTDDNHSHNEDQQQQQQQMRTTNTLSQHRFLQPLTSTPLLAPVATAANTATVTRPSIRELENELFSNIERLVREFFHRTNSENAHYRILRWTLGQEPQREYVVVVVINRPAIILE